MKKGKRGFLTLQIVQGVSQHFKYSNIQRITEGFVVKMKARIHLPRQQNNCDNEPAGLRKRKTNVCVGVIPQEVLPRCRPPI